jgi:hypothetical protein
MNMVRYLLAVGFFLTMHSLCWCQKNDTIPSFIKGKQGADSQLPHKSAKVESPYKVDSATRKKHDPRKATLYSTFCPGLGQIYNRKYWKLPLVYAAVGIPAYTYFYNKSWYQKCQYAISVIVTGTTRPDSLAKVDPKLQTFVAAKDDNSLRNYRNQYRKDEDYSVLFFLLLWGLQIVDATVDAHLAGFDVSNELSVHLQEGSNSAGSFTGLGGMNTPAAVSLVFDIHKARYKPIFVP